jgi:hypothetical protein
MVPTNWNGGRMVEKIGELRARIKPLAAGDERKGESTENGPQSVLRDP